MLSGHFLYFTGYDQHGGGGGGSIDGRIVSDQLQ